MINLRGKVIPVVDLRLKFGFPPEEVHASGPASSSSRWCWPAGRVMMGIIVDHVSEVLNIAADEIEQTPEFGDASAPTT